MSHDELIEDFAREHRYRGVLVVAAVIGIVASSVVGIAYALGGGDWASAGEPRALLGLFALPFAVAITLGAGVYNVLVFMSRSRRRLARRSPVTSLAKARR
jgi:hypothetical protein